jgi:hypothetical protein
MLISAEEREKLVLEYLEKNIPYKEIEGLLHISSRDISIIQKKAREKKEKEEKNEIITSVTSKALKLYKEEKSPLDVAILLGITAQQAQKFYIDYLSLTDSHQLAQIYHQLDEKLIQALVKLLSHIKKNEIKISEEEVVEAIININKIARMHKEYNEIYTEIANLKRKRDIYISNKNFWEKQISNLSVDFDQLVVQRDFKRKEIKSLDKQIERKKELLDDLKDSEYFENVKQKIRDQTNNILDDKKAFLKLAIMTILQTIKKDQEKDILIYNLLNYTENPRYSEEYLVYYQQKISEMADSLYDTISEITVLNITDP